MKKKLALLFAATLVAFSLSACGGNNQQSGENKDAAQTDPAFNVEVTEEMKTAAKDFSVGMVTDTGGIDDKSFNQSTWEGLSKFK